MGLLLRALPSKVCGVSSMPFCGRIPIGSGQLERKNRLINFKPHQTIVQKMFVHATGAKVPTKAPPKSKTDTSMLTRRTGALETFFKALGDVGSPANLEHAACFTVLQVQFPSHVIDTEAYIARAWVEVGRQYPFLSAEIDPPKEAQPQNSSTITVEPFRETRFRESFSTHPQCVNVDALFSAPYRGRGSTTCHWLPSPGQIVLRTSHWRTDGFGLVMLSDVFMSALAKVVQNGLCVPLYSSSVQETQNLQINPSLETLVRKHVQSHARDSKDADDLVNHLAKGGRSIVLPTKAGSGTGAATVSTRAAIRMNAASSAEVARACRARKVSITSAVNAAIIRATARFPQDSDADSYVIWAPCDLRQALIAAGARECLQPVGTYLSGLPLRIQGVVKHLDGGGCIPGKSFSALASELGSFYSQDVEHYKSPGSTSGKTVSLLELAEPYVQRITEYFSTFPLRGCPYPKTPVISSLGKMDKFIRNEYPKDCDNHSAAPKLRVTDFWVSCEVATPIITFNPWSWGGETTLSVAFNERWYTPGFACKVLEQTIRELADGLGVGPVSYRIVNNCYDPQTQLKEASNNSLESDNSSHNKAVATGA